VKHLLTPTRVSTQVLFLAFLVLFCGINYFLLNCVCLCVCRLVCAPVSPVNSSQASNVVKVHSGKEMAQQQGFTFVNPVIREIFPVFGPKLGGTMLTIRGSFLDSGNTRQVTMGNATCEILRVSGTMLMCRTPPQSAPSRQAVYMRVDSVVREAPVLFTYNEDPLISSIQPTRSFIRSVPLSNTTPILTLTLSSPPSSPHDPLSVEAARWWPRASTFTLLSSLRWCSSPQPRKARSSLW
ncbi:unnamed protein product, partial [Oncorhynchus mykiss]